jgi:hypothetical protein
LTQQSEIHEVLKIHKQLLFLAVSDRATLGFILPDFNGSASMKWYISPNSTDLKALERA